MSFNRYTRKTIGSAVTQRSLSYSNIGRNVQRSRGFFSAPDKTRSDRNLDTATVASPQQSKCRRAARDSSRCGQAATQATLEASRLYSPWLDRQMSLPQGLAIHGNNSSRKKVPVTRIDVCPQRETPPGALLQ